MKKYQDFLGEKLSIEQAETAYLTLKSGFYEDRKGRISPGKLNDYCLAVSDLLTERSVQDQFFESRGSGNFKDSLFSKLSLLNREVSDLQKEPCMARIKGVERPPEYRARPSL